MSGRLRVGLIILAALVAYANAPATTDFHFDDSHAVVENPSIRSLSNLGRFFTDPGAFSVLPQNQGYRPLLLVSYALTARFTGVNAHAFVAVNLLVHILCALLVCATLALTLRLLGRPEHADAIGLVAALLFAVHPLFSECVNYVSARSESLSALLTLAALYAYLRARENRAWIAAAVLAIAGALLTKPVATIFPLLLIAFEAAAAERQRVGRIALRFGAVTAVVLALGALSARMTPALAIQSASSFSRAQYLRSELPAVWHYLRLFVFPVGQSADADYPLAGAFSEPRVVVAAIGWALTVGFAVWGIARRRYTGLGLAIVWFVLCIFPSSSIFPLAEIVNEHRPYLAAVSLCALAAVALVEGVPRALLLDGAQAREATLTVVVLVLLPLAGATLLRNRAWRTELTLWADVVDKAPGSARAQMNLGLSLMSSGRIAESEPHLREAARLAPYYAYAQVNLGNLLLYQGKSAEAIAHLDQAISFDPNLFWAHYFRGLAAERLNEPIEARIRYFSGTTRLSPNYADGWYHLALADDASGNSAAALSATYRAVALRASFDDRLMLAYLLLKLGDAHGAKPLLDRLHVERPNDTRVNHDLELAARSEAK